MCYSLVMSQLYNSSNVFTYCSKLRDVRAKLCRPDVWKPLGLMLVLG